MSTGPDGTSPSRPATVLVAGRGSGPGDGLQRLQRGAGGWSRSSLAVVDQLSALAAHPTLPVLYGVSGLGEGTVHAWEVTTDGARRLSEQPSLGLEPCHAAVDPSGDVLVVVNYASSSLTVLHLAEDGSLDGGPEVLRLTGHGPESERQSEAHPHQVVFAGGRMYAVDLGADVVRLFALDADGRLTESAQHAVPAGTGPRHLVVLDDGALAVSGELTSTVLVGHPDVGRDWTVRPSTSRTGPVPTADGRNYPSDIQRSPDGRVVYVANRGYGTVAAFAVGSGTPELLAEIDAGVVWPQHLLLLGDELLVAGADASVVAVLPLVDGVPQEPSERIECAGAVWLLPWPAL